MRTIHIEGIANQIDIEESLSSNYALNTSFSFGEPSDCVIENIFFRFYESAEKCTLEEAVENHLEKMFGKLELNGEDFGYSEYTIEGFMIHSLKLGGHDLGKIIKNKGDKYLHILIDQVF